MRAIMVMFDSLNRRMLPPYGCGWVHAPNFKRLAERSVTFDNCFVGSMPCMPARRELHTGRYNFLHRSWGPIEPFDDSMPELLKGNGVHSHLISDHYHYWEEGGCNYHTRYKTWESVRGQEGDPWKCDLSSDHSIPGSLNSEFRKGPWLDQDWINRSHMRDEEAHCQSQTFQLGLEFLEVNHSADNWFLQIETFDPHEPFFTYEKYLKLYPESLSGPHWDWPPYDKVTQSPEQVRRLRAVNAALITMCDHNLGKILDAMDRHDLWNDTMLIVNTDHGFLLGEHDWWAKCRMPFYNEIARTPFFVWDPRCPETAGKRRSSLVQTIDIAPTLLEYFGVAIPDDMEGKPLRGTVADDHPVRDGGLFGIHGGQVNVTDGRYVYMRGAASEKNSPLYEYTLMPTHMRHTFGVEELKDIQLGGPFSFTKGCRVMRLPTRGVSKWPSPDTFKTMLFDLAADPKQERPISDPAIERRMCELMIRLMRENDAPTEQFERLGLKD